MFVLVSTLLLTIPVTSPADEKWAFKPLPPKVVAAYEKLGGELVTFVIEDNRFVSVYPVDDGKTKGLPGFNIIRKKDQPFGRFPDPNLPFGLSFFGEEVTDAELKGLSGLTQLRYLNLSTGVIVVDGSKVSDAGLKELVALKQLQVLDLDGTKISDAGMRELSHLKSLQILDLGDTTVGDAGMRDLAHVQSLQVLNLGMVRIRAV